MLTITIPKSEQFDERTNTFIDVPETTLNLEHSLVSLSKWESKWCKPFLSRDKKTREESIDYIKCMTLSKNVPEYIYEFIDGPLFKKVSDYIEAPMTATWFSEDKNTRPNREVITAEILYYDMIALNIPFECQKWHLNRLLTLIRVCTIKQQQPKKMSQNELMRRNASLNAARRKALNSAG